jgi:hypothetical protein
VGFTRVAPFTPRGTCTTARGATHVLFLSGAAYSRDYGDPVAGVDDHNGDVQAFATAWAITGPTEIGLEELWTTAHRKLEPCSVGGLFGVDIPGPVSEIVGYVAGGVVGAVACYLADEAIGKAEDYRYGIEELRFVEDGPHRGALKLYVEEDKHGIWPRLDLCNDESPYHCGGQAWRLPTVDAGEPLEDACGGRRPNRDRVLIDDLSDLTGGPHALAQFHDEGVWNGVSIAGEMRFCGGLGSDGKCGNHIGGVLNRTQVKPSERRYEVCCNPDLAARDARLRRRLATPGR